MDLWDKLKIIVLIIVSYAKKFVAKNFIMFNILEFLFAYSSINFYAQRRRRPASQSMRQG